MSIKKVKIIKLIKKNLSNKFLNKIKKRKRLIKRFQKQCKRKTNKILKYKLKLKYLLRKKK